MIYEYITKEELQQYLTLEDKELNELYQHLRKANKAFYIRECKVTFRTQFNWKHPFRKRKELVKRYEVLEDLGGQARVYCFPVAKGAEFSFNTIIGELDLKTFIYGYLSGTASTLKELEWHHGSEPARRSERYDDVLATTCGLRADIQACTDRLVNARLARDKQQETEELLRMESLMVSAAQQLQCIIDYLKEKKKHGKRTTHPIGRTIHRTNVRRRY